MARPMPTLSLCLTIPLRPDFVAQVVVPKDVTHAEVGRLKAMLDTLPIPTEEGK